MYIATPATTRSWCTMLPIKGSRFRPRCGKVAHGCAACVHVPSVYDCSRLRTWSCNACVSAWLICSVDDLLQPWIRTDMLVLDWKRIEILIILHQHSKCEQPSKGLLAKDIGLCHCRVSIALLISLSTVVLHIAPFQNYPVSAFEEGNHSWARLRTSTVWDGWCSVGSYSSLRTSASDCFRLQNMRELKMIAVCSILHNLALYTEYHKLTVPCFMILADVAMTQWSTVYLWSVA